MRDHNIFVTIAIPFYNSECFLADAIQSVVNQTYINWELLLMDDNGTDGSRKIAEKLQQKTKEYDWLVITRITGFPLVLMKV